MHFSIRNYEQYFIIDTFKISKYYFSTFIPLRTLKDFSKKKSLVNKEKQTK